MADLNWDKVEKILDEVLELDKSEQKAYIHNACKGQPELREEVELILLSIKESEGWLEDPTQFKQEFFDEISEDLEQHSGKSILIGKKIGSYQVKEEIGKGGMGAVFLAERSEGDFNHKVAIKLVHKTNATPENLNRFKQEKRILASLNHPGIAQLYDGGITEDGIPYIIMEYVDGIPITTYCELNNCSVSEKIQLFKKVLEGVKNAHENLVIHSDLKPDNILINESGQVKILDFGISKLLKDDDETLLNQKNGSALTPRYAAPEQIKEENITTATDTYALGVVFYKLLTGANALSFDSHEYEDFKKTILYQKVLPPSEKSPTPEIQQKLRGDLDAIVLKAMHKEHLERYRNASDFINDLKNYEENLPVSARVSTMGYRTGKFLNRHKKGVLLSGFVTTIIVALTLYYTSQIKEQRNQAQLEAEKAEEVTNFLVSLFNTSNPYFDELETGLDQPIGAILHYGSNQINTKLQGQPEVQAEIKTVIGDVYSSLGEFGKAETLLTDALNMRKGFYNQPHVETANSMRTLAFLYQEQGKFNEAESLLTNAIDIFEQSEEGLSTEEAISSVNRLGNLLWFNKGDYDTADSVLHRSLKLREEFQPDNQQSLASNLNDLATLYHAQGEYEKANPFYSQSIDIYNDLFDAHSNLAIIMSNYAALLREQGDLEQAEEVQQKALEMHRELTDEESIDVALGLGSLGHIKLKQGKLTEADSLINLALHKLKVIYGESHPYISRTKLNKGKIEFRKGNFDEAEEILSKVHEEYQQIFPADHPRTSDPILELGLLNLEMNNPEEARNLLHNAHEIRLNGYPKKSWRVAQSMSAYGYSLSQLQEFTTADSLLVHGYEQLKSTIGPNYAFTAKVHDWLIQHYTDWDKPDRLEEIKSD